MPCTEGAGLEAEERATDDPPPRLAAPNLAEELEARPGERFAVVVAALRRVVVVVELDEAAGVTAFTSTVALAAG